MYDKMAEDLSSKFWSLIQLSQCVVPSHSEWFHLKFVYFIHREKILESLDSLFCLYMEPLNPNLPDPMNFVPFGTMRYLSFDIKLMSLT